MDTSISGKKNQNFNKIGSEKQVKYRPQDSTKPNRQINKVK